ncbi:MAG: hypothetical protein C0513_03295 [Isosphaera sp.]|nr:hypothetical protein [Isosphaera sp.]
MIIERECSSGRKTVRGVARARRRGTSSRRTPMPDSPQKPEQPKLVVEGDWKSRQADSDAPRLIVPGRPSAAPVTGGGGGASAGGAPIEVDSDWKKQAAAEKERLAAQSDAKSPPRQGAKGAPRGLPPADFRTLLGMLVQQALLYMGAFPDPQTGRAIVAPEYARHQIDLIGVLADKSKGNLSAEEEKDITEVLGELRVQWVELMRAVEQATLERAAGKGTGAPLGGGGPGLGSPGVGGPGGAAGGLGGALRITP